VAYKKPSRPLGKDVELHLATLDGSKDVVYAAHYGTEFLHWHPDAYHFVYAQWNIFRMFLGSVCGGAVSLPDPDTPVTQIEWVDANRFLFVKGPLDATVGPRELRLGRLGGPSVLIGPYNGDNTQFVFNVEAAPLGRE
jgi:hypothetical protein